MFASFFPLLFTLIMIKDKENKIIHYLIWFYFTIFYLWGIEENVVEKRSFYQKKKKDISIWNFSFVCQHMPASLAIKWWWNLIDLHLFAFIVIRYGNNFLSERVLNALHDLFSREILLGIETDAFVVFLMDANNEFFIQN